MTVSSDTNKVTYAGDGSTTSFSTSFTFSADSEVNVVLVTDATGAEAAWTDGTQYNLTGAGTGNAGTLTVDTSPTDYTPAAGETLVIELLPAFTQPDALPRGGTVSPKGSLEPMFDRLLRQLLRIKDQVDLSLKASSAETSIAALPNVTNRATFVMGFDASGDPVMSATTVATLNTLGLGGSAQHLGGDGTVSLPYYSFSADPDSGWYRVGDNNIAAAVNGAKVLDITTAGAAVTGTLDATGAVSGTTFDADGDTAAGDNASFGYTAAEGAIITGQGSTNDVTIKNDADADVAVVPTGTTNFDIVGVATAETFEPDGDTAAGDNAAIGYTATEGLILTGQGSSYDVTIKNDADQNVMTVATGTQDATYYGDVTVTGDFTVNGDVVTHNAANYTTEDTIIELNSGEAGANANDVGLIFERGSLANVGLFWDESADELVVATTTATGTSTGNLAITAYADLHVKDLTAAAITGTSGTLAGLTSLAMSAGATLTAGFLDEDDMASDSAVAGVTQQSVKAYVDSLIKAPGLQMTWEADVDDTDKGAGTIWADNATFASITTLYIDDVENGSVSINALVDSLDDPTATASAYIYITKSGSGNNLKLFKVTGAVTSASTYSKVAVTPLIEVGTIADTDIVGVYFAFSGDNGAISNIVEDTSPQLGGTLDTNGRRIDFSEGAAVASGSSCDIWTPADGQTVHITGTTNIDDFATAPKAGAYMWVVFDGALTVNDSATITVDGNANFTTEANDMALVYAETTTTFLFKPLPVDGGSPVAASGVSGDVQTFTASGTWTKPSPTGTYARVQVWGGGGSGGKSTSAAGGGGGGGGYAEDWFLVSALGATETVTIGGGGAAVTVTNNPGNVGGNTTFGSHITGYGGGPGGGASGSRGGGGGGGGISSVGATGTSASDGLGGTGGIPGSEGGQSAAAAGVDGASGGGGGGAGKTTGNGGKGGDAWAGGGGGGGCSGGGTTAGAGGAAIWGGGGGGGGNEAATGGSAGASLFGGAGSAGTDSTNSAAGTQPGGGSGGTNTGDTGAGGDGKCVVTLF